MNAADKRFVNETLAGADLKATAIARLYKSEGGQWRFVAMGAAALAKDPASSVFYMHIVDLHTREVPLVEEVYKDFIYTAVTPFMHCFEGQKDVYAFSFADEAEAASFASAVFALPPPFTPSSGRSAHPTPAPAPAPVQRAAPAPPAPAPAPAPAPVPPRPAARAPPPVPPAAPVVHVNELAPAPAAPAVPASPTASPAAPAEKKKKKRGFFSFFRKDDDDEDEEENFQISDPTNYRHESHIGFDAETGGFDTKNIPPEWKKLFQAAGIRKKDLNNPETCAAVMQVIQSAPSATANVNAAPAPAAAPAPPPPPPPPPHAGGPAAPPAPPAPPAPTAPAAPPPPPAPVPGAPRPPPAPRAPAAGGGGAASPAPPSPTPGRSSLLDEIQKGKQLRSASARPVNELRAPELSSDEGQSMIMKLSQTISARRAAIEDDDDDDDEDEWSD